MPESGADALRGRDRRARPRSMRNASGWRSANPKQPGIGSPKLTVGLISGGINTNVVPDRIVMRLDRRLIPEENGAKVEKALIALIKRAAQGQGHLGRLPAGDPGRAAEAHRRHRAAGRAADAPRQARVESQDRGEGRAALHRRPALQRRRHSDGALRRGPRSILEANAHGADEHLKLSDLKAATRVIEATLRDVLASK